MNKKYVISVPNVTGILLVMLLFFSACGPSRKITQPVTESYRPHTIQKGESLSKIANTYDVTQEQIKMMNPGVDFNHLKSGQVIKIPFRKTEVKKEKEEEKKEVIPDKKAASTHIALLLPFNAGKNAEDNRSDNSEISIDPSSVPWIHFYQGVMLALDSLASKGNNFEVILYDTWTDSLKLLKLIRDSLFIKNDLVIGGAVNNFLPQLTDAATQYKKPLFITQNNSSSFLDQHPELYLTTPSVALQCQMISEFIYGRYEKENLIILRQDNKKENDLASLFATALEINRLKSNASDSLRLQNLVYNAKLFDKGNSLFTKSKKNIVIITSSDEAFVSPIINRLDSLDEYKFIVCGLPTWENFESIDPQKLQKLQTHIFSSTFIDYGINSVNQFRKIFIDKYKTDPVYNAFLGFSIAYLTGSILEKKEDKDFSRQVEKTESKSFPCRFDFKSKSKEDGYENHQFTILKFENYRLVVVD